MLYFTFSRKQCEIYAKELAGDHTCLQRKKGYRQADDMTMGLLSRHKVLSSRSFKIHAHEGHSYHHAGLLPIVKQFMEDLFERKLCKSCTPLRPLPLESITLLRRCVSIPCANTTASPSGRYRLRVFADGGAYGWRGIDDSGWFTFWRDYKSLETGTRRTYPSRRRSLLSKFQITYHAGNR